MNRQDTLRAKLQQSQSSVLALFFLAAWPFIFFWQATLRLRVFFFGDIFLFFYPTHLAYANALREGRLPLWEPKMLAGFPLFAEGQIGALYPLHPILYGLLPIDVATNYDILFHIAWVAVGTYLFARAFRLSPAAACLAAFAFGAGGFFYARLQHMSVLATASWLPWLMWAWEKHEQSQTRTGRLRWLGVFALFSGIQLLGGHPQFAFSSALLLGLYALVRWERPTVDALRADASQNWFSRFFAFGRLIPMGFAFVMGVGLAAAQLLPILELSSLTNRAAGLEPRYFNAFSLHPIHFLMLFTPFIQGNPLPNVSVEVIGYVGLVPLVLAICAPFLRRDRRVVFFVIVALLALFLGIGSENIVYRALRHLPLFNYFRVPSRFLFWYSFAAAMLAGISFDSLLARTHSATVVTRKQKALIVSLAVFVAVIVILIPSISLDAFLSAWTWLPLFLGLSALVILYGASRGLVARVPLVTLVLGLTVVDLALFAAVYSKTYDSMTTVDDFYKAPEALSVLKDVSPSDGRVLTSLWIYPWQGVMRESLYPNSMMTYGLPGATGYTPLIMERVSDYLEEVTAPLLNLMNVRYYLIPQMLPVDPKTEGLDVENAFGLNPVERNVVIPPTSAVRLRISSSLSQSTEWPLGQTVARIYISHDDGMLLAVPLRVGYETAEWAYERTDVHRVLPYSMPTPATTFPAKSAFPTEAHVGHSYLAEIPLSSAEPINVTGIFVYPLVPPGLIHIEHMALVSPDGREISIAHLVGRDDQTLIYRSNDVAIYENKDLLPRAFLVHNAHVLDDTTAAVEMEREDFRPAANLILDRGEPLDLGSVQTPEESVQILEYKPEHVSLSVNASSDGYLLLADAWFPGWVATVDGVETPILRGDLIFRAVRVKPGQHHIEFDYRPTSLYIGATISSIGLLALLTVFYLGRRPRRNIV